MAILDKDMDGITHRYPLDVHILVDKQLLECHSVKSFSKPLSKCTQGG